MKKGHLLLIVVSALVLPLICILGATDNQLNRWTILPMWFWLILIMMGAELFLAARWFSPDRNWSLRRYGAAQAGHFAVFFFLLHLTESALQPRIDWADALLMGVSTGLAFGVVLTVARRNVLLSTSVPSTELQ